MPFYAEEDFYYTIGATVDANQANESVPDVPNARARANQTVDLWSTIEQHWNEVTRTERKYANRRMMPHKFAVSDMG